MNTDRIKEIQEKTARRNKNNKFKLLKMFLVIIAFGFSILLCQIICTNYEVSEFAQLIMGCLLGAPIIPILLMIYYND